MPTDLPVVMVVDDDEAIRKVVGAKLKLEGFEPLPVGTGRETLEMLERREPHLIILDLGLPDIDLVTVL